VFVCTGLHGLFLIIGERPLALRQLGRFGVDQRKSPIIPIFWLVGLRFETVFFMSIISHKNK
jgi:hypothetical protein